MRRLVSELTGHGIFPDADHRPPRKRVAGAKAVSASEGIRICTELSSQELARMKPRPADIGSPTSPAKSHLKVHPRAGRLCRHGDGQIAEEDEGQRRPESGGFAARRRPKLNAAERPSCSVPSRIS